ncbi:8-amino-7-oxononanoate synthase [Idiomarina xiamenensis]|uniref:8-amino-7-oxononanoate synthase n=1 Tax=Idiomarina xiamenensis 10-D-4 TaxID=740709 RepID=K2JU46_9GAMM|nr:8-amino-7-oxononanoate synthase [Idiomarina xiamenensis]EKE86971.1 7-keto-8-amino pelargonic acid synthetase [Idiomarina xiamenensis 10-D-4]
MSEQTAFAWMQAQCQQRLQRQQLRQLSCNDGDAAEAPRFLKLHGQRYLNFSSNDYLGLSHHPELIDAYQQGLSRYGCGSTASPLVTGYQRPHAELAEQLADWLGRDQVLLFSSGFAANHGLLCALAPAYQGLWLDKLAHASLIDGARHSGTAFRRFLHNQINKLAQQLTGREGNQLLISEGIFSMDGDAAALAQLVELVTPQRQLFIDDAHGIGVSGYQGRGVAGQYSSAEVAYLTITFGKAFASAGAAIAVDNDVAQYLLQQHRELVYSTAMPPAQAYALQATLTLIAGEQGEQRRQRLQQLISYFRTQASTLGLPINASQSMIQVCLCGDEGTALAASQRLRQAGIWCSAIRPPTVPNGSSRLRFCLTAAHQREDIDRLLEALAEAGLAASTARHNENNDDADV